MEIFSKDWNYILNIVRPVKLPKHKKNIKFRISLKKREHIQCKIVLIHYDSEKMAWSHEKKCNRNCSFLKLAPVSL